MSNSSALAFSLVLFASSSSFIANSSAQEQQTHVYEAEVTLRVSRFIQGIGQPKFLADEFRVYRETQIALLKSPITLSATLRQPGVSRMKMLQEVEDPQEFLREQVAVAPIGDSEIVRVSLRGNDESEVGKILNAVVDTYLKEFVEAEAMERRLDLDKLRTKAREFARKSRDTGQDAEQTRELRGELRRRILELELVMLKKPRVTVLNRARVRPL